jgi:TPR repeat protein
LFFSELSLFVLCKSCHSVYKPPSRAALGGSDPILEGKQQRFDATMTFIKYSLLSRGKATVKAANRGNARSQAELGRLLFLSAARLEILEGASADDDTVAAMWADALRYWEGAAEKGVAAAQVQCGMIYAAGDRSVPQNWTTAAKWYRKAAEAGERGAQWDLGLCYYYGRGVGRDVAQGMVWFRKSAAQGCVDAVVAVQTGIPGEDVREVLARFTNAGSAPTRHAAAHEFVRNKVNALFLGPALQGINQMLQELDSAVPHQSVRDSLWVDFMMQTGISEEDLALAKRVYAYSLRTCRFCGSNAAPLRNCSLCMEARYCIAGDCQHADWNKTPAAESHKVLCPRIFVCGSKGRTRRA